MTVGALLLGLANMSLLQAAPAEPGTRNPARVAGPLTKIDGKALTIGETVITCNDATKFSSEGSHAPGKFQDLQVGQPVRAYYSKTDSAALAVIITRSSATNSAADGKNAARVAGPLVKVDGKTLTIGETVITCNGATKFLREGDKSAASAKLEDLQVGQQVRAYYSRTDGSAMAVFIVKSPAADPAR
jgi:hypothetical protein